jgi:hypothetical protein
LRPGNDTRQNSSKIVIFRQNNRQNLKNLFIYNSLSKRQVPPSGAAGALQPHRQEGPNPAFTFDTNPLFVCIPPSTPNQGKIS